MLEDVLLMIDVEGNLLLLVEDELEIDDVAEAEGALLLELGGGGGLLEDEMLLGVDGALKGNELLDGGGVIEVDWLLGGGAELLDGGAEVAGAAKLVGGE